MPIVMAERGLLSCPTFVCDHCGEPIGSATEGAAWWQFDEGGEPPSPLFAHRGDCSLRISRRPGVWHDVQLDAFLVYLLNGAKFDRKAAESVARLMAGIE